MGVEQRRSGANIQLSKNVQCPLVLCISTVAFKVSDISQDFIITVNMTFKIFLPTSFPVQELTGRVSQN